MRRKNSVLQYS